MIFDGKAVAARVEASLKRKVEGLATAPVLVILMVGSDEGSRRYIEMKRKLGERIGVEVLVVRTKKGELVNEIVKATRERTVGGVIVQLPIPGVKREEREEILRTIPLEKDVDGLSPVNLGLLADGEQTFIPATVKAVERVLDEAFRETGVEIDERLKIAVVGAAGSVGRPLVLRLRRYGIEVGEFELGDELALHGYKVVISCTGKAGLIKRGMVDEGVIAIDTGFPKGDFEETVAESAAFFTPVPGGVGPLTVVSLFENLVVGPAVI